MVWKRLKKGPKNLSGALPRAPYGCRPQPLEECCYPYHPSMPRARAACLVRLELCVDMLCEISASRFRLPVTEVATAVWQQACPLWTGMDECHLTRCLADTRKSKHIETLEVISREAKEMLKFVRSAGKMTSVLLPLIVEAGAGFCA